MSTPTQRLRRLIAVGLLCLAPIASADDAGLSRTEAAAALTAPKPETRREASLRLGEVGTMDDVALLLRSLDDDDDTVRALAEHSIWAIWSRSGDPVVDALFAEGAQQLAARQLADSVQTFTRIIELKPDFAEGWNKRATALFLAGDLEASLRDCDEVLKRNPSHFGVLSGYGLIHARLGHPEQALAFFERALALNPNMEGVRANIEALKQDLARKGRQAI
jgi:tetratricopeptide (TPR) repeat protein